MYNDDISDYIADALEDMKTSGVPLDILRKDTDDSRVLTAVTLYVKAYLGNDRSDTRMYLDLYRKKVFRMTLEGMVWMWNKSISLPVKKMDPTINDNGITMEETYKFIGGIPADFRDSTRDDEVLAKQNGYTADQVVEIMACNYSGESFLVDESTGDIYDIKRRFQKNKSMKVQLTCQMRERGKAQVGQWQG